MARQWAEWLVRTRTARNKRPIDLVDAASAIGRKLTTGQISNWESGRNTASPESARLVAKLLGADPVEALRAAGHDDWADFATELRGGEINGFHSDVSEVLAALRASDLPPGLKAKFERDYEALVGPIIRAGEAAEHKLAEELDEALRAQEKRRSSETGRESGETA